jgi:hypothetical protein
MPLFVEIYNLIVTKSSVISKYDGGMTQFREDFGFGKYESNFEDNELFLLAAMGHDDFNLDLLIKRGLHYDQVCDFSNDFVIIGRYGYISWKVDWLEGNKIFVWHYIADEHLKEKARKHSNLTINEVTKMFEEGNSPFETIV